MVIHGRVRILPTAIPWGNWAMVPSGLRVVEPGVDIKRARFTTGLFQPNASCCFVRIIVAEASGIFPYQTSVKEFTVQVPPFWSKMSPGFASITGFKARLATFRKGVRCQLREHGLGFRFGEALQIWPRRWGVRESSPRVGGGLVAT